VTYLNPGSGSGIMLAVTLNRPGHPASATELTAYRKHVVAVKRRRGPVVFWSLVSRYQTADCVEKCNMRSALNRRAAKLR